MNSLDSTFAALAHPIRRAIVARLAQREAPVKELIEPFQISPPAITKHLRVLEQAGLIVRSRDAQRRPCRLNSAPLEEIARWSMNTAIFGKRQENIDKLEAALAKIRATPEPQLA
jgi:DNA-binding transcriptional ArsR family regulator